jgi:NADPH2:quinone reductase
MRAAILREYGATPEVGEWQEPEGDLVVDVVAAGLNPIDLRMASGTLAARRTELPSVVGSEGIGRTDDGRRVYFDASSGSFAERAAVKGDPVEVPDGVGDAEAVAYGVAGLAAWLALDKARLSEGERVLVLGASGPVGAIALQLARLRGAGRVVAAARRALDPTHPADAFVSLAGDVAFDEEFDVVIDPLWGKPAAAAVAALAFHGRLVHLGQSAGGEATFASADVRFKELSIIGHTNFATPAAERAQALQEMWRHAAAGELTVGCETVPLAAVADAWERQAQSPGVKLVIIP